MNYDKTVLSNGLRLITIPVKGNPSVTVMAMVETGSNYESEAENGLSHFLEHMCFKGTTKRPTALDITKELDGLGAESNAFTTQETTSYYAKGEKKQFSKILDIISDLYLNPTFPEGEIEKERGVILQEISMYEDLPKSKVWDILSEIMYPNLPAGRTILGPKENIKKFTRDDFDNYYKKHYVAEKTIVIVSGDIDKESVIRQVEDKFALMPRGEVVKKDPTSNIQKEPHARVATKKVDQTAMLIGLRGYNSFDERLPALELLSTVLGEGMSSRLTNKLREEMGACYYIRSGASDYSDHGHFVISTGIDKKRITEVIEAILAECNKLKADLVSPEELEKAKEFYVGHMYMALETTDALADFYADQEGAIQKMKTPEEIEREIRAVTADDLRKVAQDVFVSSNLNLAAVGDLPENAEADIQKVLTFN